MPDTSTPHVVNFSEDDDIVIKWRGKRIIQLVTLRIPRESVINPSPLLDTIVNENIILLSITVIGYDNSSIQFNLPLASTLDCHQMYFQRLSRNDRFRGPRRTFDETLRNIRTYPGGCVFLCH